MKTQIITSMLALSLFTAASFTANAAEQTQQPAAQAGQTAPVTQAPVEKKAEKRMNKKRKSKIVKEAPATTNQGTSEKKAGQ